MGAMQRQEKRQIQGVDFNSSLALEMKPVWAILAHAIRITVSV